MMAPLPPKTPLSLSGEVQVNISGTSRGTDISLIALACVSLFGSVGCFWLSIRIPWALIGAFGFLAGFGYILSVWRRGVAARAQADAPGAQFMWKSDSQAMTVTLPVDPDNYVVKRMLSGMRSIVQARELPPTPRGAVLGNPADEKALAEYSPEEQQAIERTWAKEILEHDDLVVEELATASKSLQSGSATGAETCPTEAPGIPQLPESSSRNLPGMTKQK